MHIKIILIAMIAVGVLAGCQRFDGDVLDCEGQLFLTKQGYYSCCKARELRFIRYELERASDYDQCG